MSNTFIDLYNRLLKYNNKSVYIAFHSKTQEPYFHAKQVCQMLDYVDYHEAIRKNINKNDVFYLKNIVINYKILYKNVQGNTKFINEPGLYTLILRSKKKEATKIFNWITHEVMPSIRKYGIYKLNHKLKKQIDELNNELFEAINKIKVLEHNLKKTKFPEGGMIYIIRVIDNTIDIDPNEILYLKFGRTKNMNERKPLYDTCTKNRVQILKTIYVDDPKNIETCVIKKLEHYRIQNKKEYFKCSYNQMIEQIQSCVKFYENKDINTNLDITKLNRLNEFDENSLYYIKIINDNKNICKSINSLLNIKQSDNIQNGGNINYII
jgi:prophage antirepressor-like protein